jgi:hypothetical protein
MKTKIVIICVISFMFFSQACKKKDVKEEPEPPANNTPLKPNYTDGLFQLSYFYKLSNDSIKLFQVNTEASFYKEAKPNDSLIFIPTDADVGIVKLNDHVLEKWIDPTISRYINFETQKSVVDDLAKSPRKWFVSGNGSYKEMQYIDNDPIHNFLVSVEFPDTIYTSQNDTIRFNFTGNFDYGSIYMSDPDGSGSFIELKLLRNFDEEVVYTKSDFYYVSPFDYIKDVIVYIYLNKTIYREIHGKVIRLSYEMNYTSKRIPIKLN